MRVRRLLGPNVWRRPTQLHEGIHRFTHSRKLDLSERHERHATLLCIHMYWVIVPRRRGKTLLIRIGEHPLCQPHRSFSDGRPSKRLVNNAWRWLIQQ
jgi:hypothetical protein